MNPLAYELLMRRQNGPAGTLPPWGAPVPIPAASPLVQPGAAGVPAGTQGNDYVVPGDLPPNAAQPEQAQPAATPFNRRVYEALRQYVDPANEMTNKLLGPHASESLRRVGEAAQFTDLGDAGALIDQSRKTIDALRNEGWQGGQNQLGPMAAMMLATALPGVSAKGSQSMYDIASGSIPRYKGAAPDRSGMTYLRYRPGKNTSRVQASIDAMRDPNNLIRKQMLSDIERGKGVGKDWYNTEELRDWFMKELGEEQGHKEWSEYMDLIGATSPGSKVPANIGNASAVRQQLYTNPDYVERLNSVSNIADARAIAREFRPKGYGHKTQGLQEQIVSRQQRGDWSGMPETSAPPPAAGNWTDQPKPKGFAQSLKGNETNIAADLHFTRYIGMASGDPQWLSTQAEIGKQTMDKLVELGGPKVKKYLRVRDVDGKPQVTFNPKKAVKEGALTMEDVNNVRHPAMWSDKPNAAEYAALEDLMGEIGREVGMTPAQVQASLWMGAAERTGVDKSSLATFMDIFRQRADMRAAKEGMSREDVIRRFIRDKGLLAVPVGAGALASSMFAGDAAAAGMPKPKDKK